MTKTELIKSIADSLSNRQVLTTTQAMGAIAALNPQKQDLLTEAMNSGDVKKAGEILINLAGRKKNNIAEAAVTTAFAGDSVTVTDLISFLS